VSVFYQVPERANLLIVGPLQGPDFPFQFAPGLLKAGAFNHPGLFKLAPCRDIYKKHRSPEKQI
jgi:hypothetical protein